MLTCEHCKGTGIANYPQTVWDSKPCPWCKGKGKVRERKGWVQPFGSGTQFGDWEERNCASCWKFNFHGTKTYNCPIDKALGEAYMGDGLVSPRIAERMGYKDKLRYTWDCPEREDERPPRKRKAPALEKTPLFGKI